jgi:hypothetical protein
MIAKLDTRATPSRSLWPAVENNFQHVEAGLTQAVETMSNELNKLIERMG